MPPDLFTGGSRGIGSATALRLAKEGADVAFSYANRLSDAEETAAAIRALGRRTVFSPCNVAVPDDVRRLLDRAHELGPIDYLVHRGAISNIRDHSTLTDSKRPAGCLTHPWPILATRPLCRGRTPFAGASAGQPGPSPRPSTRSGAEPAVQGPNRHAFSHRSATGSPALCHTFRHGGTSCQFDGKLGAWPIGAGLGVKWSI
jgi:hypothetical protein